MSATFVDTSYLIALVRTRDAHHARAMTWRTGIKGDFLTTEYVLLEFIDAMCQPPVRQRALATVRALRGDDQMHIVPGSTALLDQGLEFFARHADKRWSLTDCISFVVMRREGITDALTSDHDFEQAGFRALLRSDPS